MSLIDLLVAVVVAWFAWNGFGRGLAASAVWLACIAATPYLTGYLTPFLATWMGADMPDLPEFMRQPAAFVVSLAIAGLAVGTASAVLAGLIRKAQAQWPVLRAADKVFGAGVMTVTALAGLAVVTILLSGIISAPGRERLSASVWGSAVMPRFQPLVPYVLALVQEPLGKAPALLGIVPGAATDPGANAQSVSPAARLLATVLAVGGVPQMEALASADAKEINQVLDLLMAGSGAGSASPESTQATRLLLETLAGPGQAGGSQLPAGTSEAARLLLEALAKPVPAATPTP